jgi:hypothetical protein
LKYLTGIKAADKMVQFTLASAKKTASLGLLFCYQNHNFSIHFQLIPIVLIIWSFSGSSKGINQGEGLKA